MVQIFSGWASRAWLKASSSVMLNALLDQLQDDGGGHCFGDSADAHVVPGRDGCVGGQVSGAHRVQPGSLAGDIDQHDRPRHPQPGPLRLQQRLEGGGRGWTLPLY